MLVVDSRLGNAVIEHCEDYLRYIRDVLQHNNDGRFVSVQQARTPTIEFTEHAVFFKIPLGLPDSSIIDILPSKFWIAYEQGFQYIQK